MKKVLIAIMFLVALSFAVPPKGGVVPCLATCCLGSRVGLEMNEGTRVRSDEWIGLVASMLVGVNTSPYMAGYQAFVGETMNEQKDAQKLGGPMIKATAPESAGGCGPALASFCLSPRLGLEMNDGRKLRNRDYLYLIPIVNLVPLAMECGEAYSGKTMTEIAMAEGLDK